ncbi:MAG: hypothetical protein U9N87_10105 [Planctomycetota bacterium]|nr:hypothetical protein [Planctomycetota bacterium]
MRATTGVQFGNQPLVPLDIDQGFELGGCRNPFVLRVANNLGLFVFPEVRIFQFPRPVRRKAELVAH